ncbi:MAG: four helix bundle protein [Burkholderiales bacterium]|nr:four helix bundle protein [Burkholderiales bacterium]
MTRDNLPPIAKAAETLLAAIEQAVSRFPRTHRYTAGADLRHQAMLVTELTHRAWREESRRVEWAYRLKWEIDGLKIKLQLCSRLRAFSSFGQYEELARQARAVGKQAGGWYSQLIESHPKGQNGHGGHADAQRAQELSTRGTSQWEVYL